MCHIEDLDESVAPLLRALLIREKYSLKLTSNTFSITFSKIYDLQFTILSNCRCTIFDTNIAIR